MNFSEKYQGKLKCPICSITGKTDNVNVYAICDSEGYMIQLIFLHEDFSIQDVTPDLNYARKMVEKEIEQNNG